MTSSNYKILRIFYFVIMFLLLGATIVVSGGCTRNSDSSATDTKTKSSTEDKDSNESDKKTGEVRDSPGQDLGDLRRYPDSLRIADTIIEGEKGKKSGTLVYQTSADITKVIQFYIDEAETENWKLGSIVDTKVGQILQMSKENRRVSVSISRREKKEYTEVVYLYREY